MSMIPDQPDDYIMTEPKEDQNTPGGVIIAQPVYRVEHPNGKRRMELAKWSQVITWIFFALEIALGFRVLLKIIAANPLNPFAQFIYGLTRPFVAPFTGLTVTPDVSGSVLEITSLIGMIVYGVLYWLVIRLIWIVFNPTEPGDANRYEPDL